ncbi:MAG: hypothetical protein K2Q06_03115 [Parvularculaceae bacterium]|nr:hypothetical protein [Parvularculaceae bacterium]
MSALADLEITLRRDHAIGRLAETHSHRAEREDSMGVIRGRDAIEERWVAEDPHPVVIDADFGDMISFTAGEGDRCWRGQRWVTREDNRIVREIVIEARPRAIDPPLLHPPLGELRAGRGQFGAGPSAVLPLGFAEEARAVADRLHRVWNGRLFDEGAESWVVPLIRKLPDATFYFERALVDGRDVALLWRVHGHDGSGRRIRLLGGTIVRHGAAADSVLDISAAEAQVSARHIDPQAATF